MQVNVLKISHYVHRQDVLLKMGEELAKNECKYEFFTLVTQWVKILYKVPFSLDFGITKR